jgi:hypothetical protein
MRSQKCFAGFPRHADWLGIGTFKTVHPGYLTLVHLAMEGLGQRPNKGVAVKQMYVLRAKPTETNPNRWLVTWLMPVDEFCKTIMRANVLQWVVSIMTFTYSFINHFIHNSPSPPPFLIPNVRFVYAGVAVVHQQLAAPLASATASICHSYLIEEHINEELDSFYKFINNGSAVPLPFTRVNKSLSVLAEFLAFTQHVQYYKTSGMVYLSDIQGENLCLTTDCH